MAKDAPRAGGTPGTRLGTVIVGWTITFAIATAAAGVIDGLWSWSPAGQYLPGGLGRMRWLAYLATSHALAGAVLGLGVGLLVEAWSRLTRLGDLARYARAEHDRRRAIDPGDTVAGLSLVLVGLPVIAGALGAAYLVLVPTLTGRKHPGLVVASAMGGAAVALGVGVLVAFLLARPVERGLRRLTRNPKLAGPLSAFTAPFWAALALALAGGAVVLAQTWSTVKLLPQLRAPAIGLAALVLAIGAHRPGRAAADRLAAVPVRRRAAILAGAVAAAVLAMFVAGADSAVIKAAAGHTGLGGPIAHVVRRAFDFDHDGYARFLGGGDCDDGDATVHPGASEIPGDGIDQNCVGGDPSGAPRPLADIGFVPVPAGVPAGANILLLTIDTLRADHLGSYGYARPTSPVLDAIAAGGTRFANAWAHAPSTRYSMPAILTGRLPLDVHYDYAMNWPGLLPAATTIAELLKPLGFHTGAITNYDYFVESRRMNQGFDEYDNTNQRLHRPVPGHGPEETQGSSSKEQTDKAIDFVGRHAADRWFLWVHYYDPHAGYATHPEVPGFGSDDVAKYDGEIRFTDLHIGRLIDDLKARGLYDKTIIVITGDHGEGFGEHGVTRHGYHLYAAQTKVPIVIRVPGLAPRVSATPAGHVDLMPTLVDLAGGQPDPEMMGRSLVDVLAGAPDRDRPVFQQLSYENNHEMRAAAGQRCHVIYNVSPDTSWEAYRVDVDPAERHDVDSDAGPCAPVRRELERWYDAPPAGAADALLPARPAIERPLGVFLGDEVELMAVELPAQARPGETVTATWTFAAHGALGDGWKVFAHFENGKGGRFTGDHAPARPFAWWRDGQYVRYATQVTVPRGIAPGRYELWTGVFKGGARRKARAPAGISIKDDRVDVAAIEVAL